jgi:ubiquinone/menaquinone biosynthesis C-methylase UbiE
MIDYNRMASEYAKHREIHPGVFESFISDGRIGGSSSVLEIGCGTGNYIGRLHRLTDCQSYGIDPSQQMLSIAKEKFPASGVRKGKAEKLGFEPDFFDLVFSVDVIHHITDKLSYFREAYRVLKLGGKVCTVTDSEWIIGNHQPLSVYFPETVAVELKRYPSINQIRGLMQDRGFHEINDKMVEFPYELTDASAYRSKVFSSLQLISEEDFQRGLKRMEEHLAKGPISPACRAILSFGEASNPILG